MSESIKDSWNDNVDSDYRSNGDSNRTDRDYRSGNYDTGSYSYPSERRRYTRNNWSENNDSIGSYRHNPQEDFAW